MFVVAEIVEADVWKGVAGIFTTEEAALRFQDSLDEKWSYQIFPVTYPTAFPFFLTGAGLEVPKVRPLGEDELERLLAEVCPGATEEDWTILFNVYSVLQDSFNEAFPGEPVLPKLNHFHVTPREHDFRSIRDRLLTPRPVQPKRLRSR
ncbi:MAG: hypothetical protein ACRD1T_16015 [Acidimicrobiia bacterium]